MYTFADWNKTPWAKIDVDMLVEETKKLTKDVKTLNKSVSCTHHDDNTCAAFAGCWPGLDCVAMLCHHCFVCCRQCSNTNSVAAQTSCAAM